MNRQKVSWTGKGRRQAQPVLTGPRKVKKPSWRKDLLSWVLVDG